MYLVGDIGGTKTLLAWAWPDGETFRLGEVHSHKSTDASGLDELVDTLRDEAPGPIQAACFGIAGPVLNGRCETTNLPWSVDEASLSARLGCPARLLNDLEALGHAIPVIPEGQLLTLNEGDGHPGNRALIAAGTGLGEAILFWDGEQHHVSPSEGGHADFAPRDDLHIALLQRLRGRHHHVSVERLVCGDGLAEIYAHLSAVGVPGHDDAARDFAAQPRGEVVSAAALEKGCPRALLAVDTFLDLYGAEAGNLALKAMARGGVYIGGGIAPKLLPRLKAGAFVSAFLDKGRFRDLMASMPVKVILNPQAALLGAASVAHTLP